VSVGCAERVLPGVLTCRIEDFPGVKAPKVLVCRAVNGTFSRIAEFPDSVTDQQIMQSCPNGNCPNIAHPLQNAFLGLAVQEVADIIVETKVTQPATQSEVVSNPVTVSGYLSGCSYGRVAGRLLGLPFRGVRAIRHARACRIAERCAARQARLEPVEIVEFVPQQSIVQPPAQPKK
jgi:hypothetical protein